MIRKISSTQAFVLMFLSGHLICFAQLDPWERVKLIEPGKSVSIALRDGKSVNGKMREWSPDGITLLHGKDHLTQVLRADVATISLRAGMSRGRRAAWAGLIGGGAGAGIFGAACGNGDCDIPPAAAVAGGGLYIGGIAAGIAALIPQHKELIYKAEPAPSTSTGARNDGDVQGRREDRPDKVRDGALTGSAR